MLISGDLTLQTVGRLAATPVKDLLSVRVIDLAGVGRVDSSAVALLLHWLRQTADAPHRFTLVNVPDELRSLANLYDVADMLPIDSRMSNSPSDVDHA